MTKISPIRGLHMVKALVCECLMKCVSESVSFEVLLECGFRASLAKIVLEDGGSVLAIEVEEETIGYILDPVESVLMALCDQGYQECLSVEILSFKVEEGKLPEAQIGIYLLEAPIWIFNAGFDDSRADDSEEDAYWDDDWYVGSGDLPEGYYHSSHGSFYVDDCGHMCEVLEFEGYCAHWDENNGWIE